MVRNLLVLSLATFFIQACGQNDAGDLGLGADGRCIPSTLAPFGQNLAPLSLEQKKILVANVKKVLLVRKVEDYALLAKFPRSTLSDVRYTRIMDGVDAGKCKASTVYSPDYKRTTITVSGSGCPIDFKDDNFTTVTPDAKRVQTQVKKYVQISDPALHAEDMHGHEVDIKSLTVRHGGAVTELNATICAVAQGKYSMTAGALETYHIFESYLNKHPTPVTELRERRGIRVAGISAIYECKIVGDKNLCTLNGEAMKYEDFEALGIAQRDFGDHKW